MITKNLVINLMGDALKFKKAMVTMKRKMESLFRKINKPYRHMWE